MSLVDGGSGFDGESVDVGVDVHAGLRFLITPGVAIFAQYRYTRCESDVEIQSASIDIDLESELATHHIAGGIGFHF